jgi:hypothetical protein
LTALGVVLLCLVVATSVAPAAFKRAPIDLGPGDGNSPSVVVDSAGTTHAAWGIAEDLIGYCAIPRGARRCVRSARLSLDARNGRPIILQRPQDGLLVIVAGRKDFDDDPDESVWAFTSADGVAWSGPAPIGRGLSAVDAAALTADGQAVDVLQGETGGNLFQRAPLGGPASGAVLNLASTPAGATTDFTRPGDLVRLRNGRTLALLGGSGEGFAYRILRGADPFADASWRPWPAARVTRESGEPRAAAGPRGAYVMYGVHIVDQVYGAAPQVVRRLRGSRWRRPRGLFFEVTANTGDAALAEDAEGRLHAVVVGTARGGRLSCIAYARTGKRRWFSRAVSLHQTLKSAEAPGRLRLAVGPSGGGVVAWATRGTPSVARVQRLRRGRGVTRPRAYARRGCPPFPRARR